MRFFLGVGRYTPNVAVSGEMGWISPEIRQWKSIAIHLSRVSYMLDCRVNKRVALCTASAANRSCKNWFFYVNDMLKNCNAHQYSDIRISIPKHTIVNIVTTKLQEKFVLNWLESLNSVTGPSGRGGNKLRTYRLFKTEYETELYCKLIMPPCHRTAFSKFRCGVAPLRIETGRYEGLDVLERKCQFCDSIEDESHVILDCFVYDDLRQSLFDKAKTVDSAFVQMSKNEQLIFLFTKTEMIRYCAKTCFNILQRRLLFSCK